MRIRRLGWAGLEVTAAGASLVIDAVQDGSALLNSYLTGEELVPPKGRRATAALVTHLHDDHTDVRAIEAAVGAEGIVLRPAPFAGSDEENVLTLPIERLLADSALDARVVAEWQTTTVGPFTVTAVPAIDGLGDPQINWVVEAEGVRLFHGGDTMFHGYWWLIARRLGPIDVAAMPVNRAIVDAPHLQPPSPFPADLGPAEAVHAAHILRARTILPMHFGMVWPGGYDEADHPVETVRALAADLGLSVAALVPGQSVEVAAR